ncbi:transposase family protein [Microcoleus sp. K1-B6]|uniref:transposase family protein n=1 Tax=unclassified Microcoleus TaxID=2642155 RepID=UPI002FD57124
MKNPKAVVEIGVIQESLVKHFRGLKNPRLERTKRHQLTDILVIAILAIIGGARGIENEAHWTFNCTFASDACRIRSFPIPRNFAILQRIVLNAINRKQTHKRSIIQKMKRKSMDNDYMSQVPSYCFKDSTLDSLYSLCKP